MNKATTTSLNKILNSKINSVLKKNEKKEINKKLLFKQEDIMQTTTIEKISY